MDYAIHFADLLRQHLRALRKSRGLTQAQLGARLGVGQVRIAEIESAPGAVSVEQLIRLLSALDATLVVRDSSAEAKTGEPASAPARPGPARKKGSQQSKGVEERPRHPYATADAASARNVVIRPKKGSW